MPTLEERYPEPSLGDLLTMRDRIARHSQGWLRLVNRVRELRYHQDVLPEKWAQELSLDEEHRFRTNLTDNEISRVVALMTRNRPKVYIPPAGTKTQAQKRSQKQTRWGQELIEALERQSVLPIWDRGDDSAVETALGVYEFFLTDDFEEYADRAETMKGLTGADRAEAEAALRAYGLPFGIRALDPTTVYWEPSYGKRSCGRILIVEKKDYRQVFGELADKLTDEQWNEAQLPPIAALGMPDASVWNVRYESGDDPAVYAAVPDDGQVEVIRYYDEHWIVEAVAGRIVQAEPHGFPGVPVFLQFGKVTSSSFVGNMLRGVTFGMLEHETALNDILTLWEDNHFAYDRPFPAVETSENGSPLTNADGTPQVIHLDDPHKPPQLGPGQKIVDAFGGFRGQMDPQFITMLNSYFHMSGLNPIAQGESPGADTSGFALNTQQSAATALYVQLLKNKQRTMGEIIDFCRTVVRDVLGFGVTVASGGEDGRPIEYVTLEPEDVDDVPTRVNIDPLSDAQRMAITQWAQVGNERGYISRRTVQRVGYGSVIDDLDAEDDAIVKDGAKRELIPVLVQAVVQRVVAKAFPELNAAPPEVPPGATGAESGVPGMTPPQPSTIGREGARASQVSRGAGGGGQSPAQGMAARSRGGQQPVQQGIREQGA